MVVKILSLVCWVFPAYEDSSNDDDNDDNDHKAELTLVKGCNDIFVEKDDDNSGFRSSGKKVASRNYFNAITAKL